MMSGKRKRNTDFSERDILVYKIEMVCNIELRLMRFFIGVQNPSLDRVES